MLPRPLAVQRADMLRSFAKLPVHAYRYLISPLLPGACRFYPTCSEYTLEAIEKRGVVKGAWLALRRLARCQPWGGHGCDPVP